MKPVLELVDLHRSFGHTRVICGVSMAVKPGERLALIGPNGAGKSTLFNLISGRLRPTRGDVRLHGQSVAGLPPHRINRLGLSRSFQITNIFTQLSVFENLRCSLLWSLGYRYSLLRRLARLHDANQRAEALLEQVGLAYRRDTPASELSYAEQRALEIAITLAGGADLILLDEPTAGMSSAETQRFIALIRRLTQGRTLLVVEHDMGVVFDLADRVAVLVQGELLALDTPAAVRADPRVQEAYLGLPVESA